MVRTTLSSASLGQVFLGLLLAAALGATEVVRPVDQEPGVETEHVLLSGPDSVSPRLWTIEMATGPRAGTPQPIAVPGNWEPLGFGDFIYGHDEHESADRGRYTMRFEAPARWAGRMVELVFEGVMTDTTVFLDGRQVGETHQGGYTEFRYDLSGRLRPGGVHELAVEVSERSANKSINLAEREGDYWVWGGIYRPVRLEVHPAAHIAHLAIDARHDGTLLVESELRGLDDSSSSWWLDVNILEGGELEASAPIGPRGTDGLRRTKLAARAGRITPWTAEAPHLTLLEIKLRRGNEVVHQRREWVGFRTVELARPGRVGRAPGLLVNGQRVFLKGVNRHDSWPASGRSIAHQRSRADAELIRNLGFNAVRMAHYPPSRAFLEACDELGLYVLNELPGWHDPYDTDVGRLLVAEMVRRDVNHPSVIAWANGNEGGWNRALVPEYSRHDVQRRPVLFPDDVYGDVDARHYPSWSELESRLTTSGFANVLRRVLRRPGIVLPTEMLHGLWDGGGGASLADFTGLLRRSPRGAGYFLWAFADESVERVDAAGSVRLDSAGNLAPDGIVGPYREWEASAFAVRAIQRPITATWVQRPGVVEVANHFDHTDLDELGAVWRWLDLPEAGAPQRELRVVSVGTGRSTETPPTGRGALEVGLPPADADVLELSFMRPLDGRVVSTQRLALPVARQRTAVAAAPGGRAVVAGPAVELEVAGSRARFDAATGELVQLTTAGRTIVLPGGARRLDGGPGVVTNVEVREGSRAPSVSFDFGPDAPLRRVTWTLAADGSLHFSWLGERRPGGPWDGVRFELPGEASAIEWVGAGPCPVWRNRREGGEVGLWRQPDATLGLGCNSTAGFFEGVRWMRVTLAAGTLLLEPESGAVSVGVPTFPVDSKDAVALLPPPGGLSFLHEIPAIGTKFHPAADLGPSAAVNDEPGLFRGAVRLTVVDG